MLFIGAEFLTRLFFTDIHLSGTELTLLRDSVYFDSPGLVPNAYGLSNGAIKYVDSIGFWKYGKSNRKKKTKKKWLFLGDSVTMGIGVKNDSTFAGRISSDLSDVEILNPSLIGYSNKDYLNVVKKLIAVDRNKLGISSVYLFWCLNDVYSDYDSLDLPGISKSNFVGEINSFFRKNSKLYHLLKETFTDRPKAYYLYDERFYNLSNNDFQKAISNLIDIKKILDENNISFTVILLPYEYQLRQNNPAQTKPQSIISSELREENIQVFDVLNSDEFQGGKELYLFGDGIHFSNMGHRKIAKIFKKFLMNKN